MFSACFKGPIPGDGEGRRGMVGYKSKSRHNKKEEIFYGMDWF